MIKEIKEIMKKEHPEIDLSNKVNLKELGLTFEQAVQFLQKRGISVTLGKEDTVITENQSDYESLEDLVAVHVTEFSPKENTIRTPKSSSAMLPAVTLNDGTSVPERKHVRDTVHTCVNGPVSEHASGNKWSQMKYAVIVPVKDIPKEKIGSACSVDLFTVGDLEIPNTGYILCPEAEREEIQKNNPNVQVIGCEGQNVYEYSKAFITTLGYKYEEGLSDRWDSDESQKKYDALMEREGIRTEIHDSTKYRAEETAFGDIEAILAFAGSYQKTDDNAKFISNIIRSISGSPLMPTRFGSIDKVFTPVNAETIGYNLDDMQQKVLSYIQTRLEEMKLPQLPQETLDYISKAYHIRGYGGSFDEPTDEMLPNLCKDSKTILEGLIKEHNLSLSAVLPVLIADNVPAFREASREKEERAMEEKLDKNPPELGTPEWEEYCKRRYESIKGLTMEQAKEQFPNAPIRRILTSISRSKVPEELGVEMDGTASILDYEYLNSDKGKEGLQKLRDSGYQFEVNEFDGEIFDVYDIDLQVEKNESTTIEETFDAISKKLKPLCESLGIDFSKYEMQNQDVNSNLTEKYEEAGITHEDLANAKDSIARDLRGKETQEKGMQEIEDENLSAEH